MNSRGGPIWTWKRRIWLEHNAFLSADNFWKEVLGKHSICPSVVVSLVNVRGSLIILDGDYIFTFSLAETVR